MMVEERPALIIIIGPIAVGKSTLAAEVGQRLRGRGESVAVVGLDSVAEMALPDLDWTWAHQVHGQLVRAWLDTPVRTVIAEGPSTPAEVEQLMRCVPGHIGAVTVLLTTRCETALARAAQDPLRGISKDPDFLRRDHDRFERGRAQLTYDLALDSAGGDPSTLADRVLQALDDRRARQTPVRPDARRRRASET
jgi:thymidylate kinase